LKMVALVCDTQMETKIGKQDKFGHYHVYKVRTDTFQSKG
jgi:hypothetical protein